VEKARRRTPRYTYTRLFNPCDSISRSNGKIDVLARLITRYPSNRLTATTFQSSAYFNSILVSTLRFLERDTFNAKLKEEQTSFLRGLVRILPQFSDKVVKRKILPSLLEETRKTTLLPFLLPNIFYVAGRMDTVS
jgi:SCY1-like protein 2